MVGNMDHWLYKLASSLVFISDDDNLSWDSNDEVDFSVRIYVSKAVITEDKKRLPAKAIVFYNISNKYHWIPSDTDEEEKNGPYKILKFGFVKAKPSDVKAQLEALSGYESFKWVKSIHIGH